MIEPRLCKKLGTRGKLKRIKAFFLKADLSHHKIVLMGFFLKKMYVRAVKKKTRTLTFNKKILPNIFHPFLSAFIVDFEQIFVYWACESEPNPKF